MFDLINQKCIINEKFNLIKCKSKTKILYSYIGIFESKQHITKIYNQLLIFGIIQFKYWMENLKKKT